MMKIALIILSLFSTSLFASELDTPVTNISNELRFEKELPKTMIVRVNAETNKNEFAVIEETAPENMDELNALAKSATFSTLPSAEQVHELDRESGVASFYFHYNYGYYYPYVNYYSYTYNYSFYTSWNWAGYWYYCYRLRW